MSTSRDCVVSTSRSHRLGDLEAEAKELLGQRKRRKRLRYSCTECARRKHKCDLAGSDGPCSTCVARGVAEACRPANDDDGDLVDRVRRLENVLAQLVDAKRDTVDADPGNTNGGGCGAGRSNVYSPTSLTAVRSERETQRHGTRPASERCSQCGHRTSIDTVAGAVGRASAPLDWLQHPSSREGSVERRYPTLYSGSERVDSHPRVASATSESVRARVGAEDIEFSSSFKGVTPSNHFARLVREGGASSDAIRRLTFQLPSYRLSSDLIDIFFRDINDAVLPIDELWFREALSNASDFFWGQRRSSSSFDDGLADEGPDHLSLLALLFAVLSTTYRCQPPSMGSEAEGAATAATMSHASRHCLSLAASIQSNDLYCVCAHMLLARFYMLQRQGVQGWLSLGTAIRQAQVLGLHSESLDARLTAKEVAVRRLVWSHLHYEDRIYSLLLGQAPMVTDRFCTARPPSFSNDTQGSTANISTFLSLRHRLTDLAGRALVLFHSQDQPLAYEQILDLDDELQRFRASLPEPYRLDAPCSPAPAGLSGYESKETLALHRHLLSLELSFVRMSLHQPYLKLGGRDEYARSRSAALEAALWDDAARRRLEQDIEWNDRRARKTFMGGGFFRFQAMATIALHLLSSSRLEPPLPWAPSDEELLDMLEGYVNASRVSQSLESGDPNRTSRQEVNIVNLMLVRIRQRRAGALQRRTVESPLAHSTQSSDPSGVSSSLGRTTSHSHSWSTPSSTKPASPNRPAPSTAIPVSLPADDEATSHWMPLDGEPTHLPLAGEDLHSWWSSLVAGLFEDDEDGVAATLSGGGGGGGGGAV